MTPGPPRPSDVKRDKQQLEDIYAITDEDRRELIEWIGSLGVPAATVKALAKGTDLDKVADAWCPNCSASVKVRYPDYKGMAAFFKLLFEYKLQKPSEIRELHVSGRVVHELEALSTEELEQIAEGEWVPQLPPAA